MTGPHLFWKYQMLPANGLYQQPLNISLSLVSIDKSIEPKPQKEFEKADLRHFKELNEFPAFMCIRAVKKK